MNPFLAFFVAVLVAGYLVELVVELRNLQSAEPDVPEELRGVYDAERYARSQRYLRERTRFDLGFSSIATPVTLGFVLAGGFRWVDSLARAAGGGLLVTGLIFVAVLALLSQLLSMPFAVYGTFVLEARYGFNRTSPATFVLDRLKGAVLAAVIGGPMLVGVLWFFSRVGRPAWLYAWAFVAVLQLAWTIAAPVIVLPLFNRFVPLAPGELRDSIHAFARRQSFDVAGIFTMDGSKRTSKANAFFTGFGRFRRIVLFDTLIRNHSVDELVSVLAHEIGHSRLRHVPKQIAGSLASMALMFFVLSWFLENPRLYEAFGVSMVDVGGYPPIYAGMVFFGMLYGPIALVPGLWMRARSRRHEYEADRFAVRTHGRPDAFVAALGKLSAGHLANLTPHPWKVFLEYSHPPVVERIRAIRRIAADSGVVS